MTAVVTPGHPGVCRSCKAQILWATTERGKPIPLDATPVDDGNIEFTGITDIVRVLPAGQCDLLDDTPVRFVSHFVTCPERDEWRKH